MLMRNKLIRIVVLTVTFLIPSMMRAQDTASLTGVVTDSSGAVMRGVDVLLVDTKTNSTYHAKTGPVGSYTIPSVAPGSGYKVSFSADGFVTSEVSNIALGVGTTRTQNAVLHAGSAQTVEVVASTGEVTIDTTDATIGNNLDVKLLNDLPVQVRDSPAVLFTLQPGVAAGAFTGARTDQTDITVDGLDVNDITTGQSLLIVSEAPVDSIQEFRGTVAGQLSSSGPGGGGQFQLVTRSGTNSFHGDINEYHRDTNLVANTWFGNSAGVPRAPLIRNQFGGQAGGPILKNKLFFFFNFYDSRTIQSAAEETIVPLPTYSSGIISYILNNPTSGSTACTGASRENTTPECIGTLTAAQTKALDPQGIGFSSVIQSFLTSRYPAPNDLNAGDGVNTAGFRFNAPTPTFETNYVAKIDYTLNKTMRLFARATVERDDGTSAAIKLPTDPVSNPEIDRSYSYVAGHTWTIGANKTNAFSYGDTIEKFNFPATFDPSGTSVLTFGAGTNPFLGDPYNSQSSQKRRIPIPVVRDDFNWQKGSHNLGFGGTFKFIKTESQQVNDFNFVGLGLGGETESLNPSLRPANIHPTVGSASLTEYDNAFAFALGRIGSVSTNYNYTNSGTALPQGTGHIRRYRYYETELYAGDTWKVTKALTVSYGLRYQLYSVPYEVSGEESIPNFGFDQYFATRVAQSAAGISGNTAVPFITYNLGGKANNAAPLYKPSYKDFAPRFSFAYNPSYFPKLVINGGAGIVYDRTVINALNFLQDQTSYLFQNSANKNNGNPSDPVMSLQNDPRIGTAFAFNNPNIAPTITKPFTPFVTNNVPMGLISEQTNLGIDTNLKDPYSIAFNAGIQQQLPGNFVLKVNYVGRLGRRLIGFADASQLLDFPDKTSGQLMSTAFANITKAARAGANTANLPAQPWFENVAAAAAPVAAKLGYPNVTSFLADNFFEVPLGDFADFIQGLSADGFIPANVGLDSQISINSTATNKGFSSYNGLLTTLSKNLNHGLQFDFNYTWSHSIDNTSLIANSTPSGTGIGFICELQNLRACRGNSDFDETTVVNADFTYELPVGRGRQFGATEPRWLDEIIGGWAVSGLPQWHSGVAFTAFSNAFVAGFANNAPATFNGNRGAVATHLHKSANGSVNLFTDPAAADAAFTGPIGFQIGSRNNLRAPSAWGMDAGLAKTFPLVSDRVYMKFRTDAFNVFNHPTFGAPTSANEDITQSSAPFGQINATTGAPRVLQLALRVEF
jgi:Carboxypeptidase regulatory-like domain